MAQGQLPIDLAISGNLAAKTLTLTTASVTDAMIVAAAGVQASKLQHQYIQCYSQLATANAATDRQIIHVCYGATASVVQFAVGAVTAATADATATIDLKKNGSTILTSTISLTASTAAYVLLNGTLAAGALSLVAGNVLEIHITAVSAGSGALAKGLFALLVVREDAQ